MREALNAGVAARLDKSELTVIETALAEVEAPEWKKGDLVYVGGRAGTVAWDGRPNQNFAQVVWADTGIESVRISVDQIMKATPAASASTKSATVEAPKAQVAVPGAVPKAKVASKAVPKTVAKKAMPAPKINSTRLSQQPEVSDAYATLVAHDASDADSEASASSISREIVRAWEPSARDALPSSPDQANLSRSYPDPAHFSRSWKPLAWSAAEWQDRLEKSGNTRWRNRSEERTVQDSPVQGTAVQAPWEWATTSLASPVASPRDVLTASELPPAQPVERQGMEWL